MEAPREKVINKLLDAHRLRAKKSIAEYSPSTSNVSNDILGSVSNTRKLHQVVIAGLIEACKAISELFEPVDIASPTTSHRNDKLKELQADSLKRDLVEKQYAYQALQETISEIRPLYQQNVLKSLTDLFRVTNQHMYTYSKLEEEEDRIIASLEPYSEQDNKLKEESQTTDETFNSDVNSNSNEQAQNKERKTLEESKFNP
jgi:hypothetical protein